MSSAAAMFLPLFVRWRKFHPKLNISVYVATKLDQKFVRLHTCWKTHARSFGGGCGKRFARLLKPSLCNNFLWRVHFARTFPSFLSYTFLIYTYMFKAAVAPVSQTRRTRAQNFVTSIFQGPHNGKCFARGVYVCSRECLGEVKDYNLSWDPGRLGP